MVVRFLYKTYGWFYRFRCWRNHHITPAGMMILTAIFLSGILGFNIFKTTLYQIMAFAFSIMAVSLVFSLVPFRPGLRVRRILPEYATVGEKTAYEIEIQNISSTPQKGLILYEEIHDPRPQLKTLVSKKEPFEHLRNIWDRKILYYRWLWLIQKNRKAGIPPVDLPDLPAGETLRVKMGFVPQYRGYLNFSGVTFARPDALGLFNRVFKKVKKNKVLVLPRPYALDSFRLIPTRQYHPGGICLASSIGDSEEFMSLRQYRPGDPLRNIHWRSFAKTNELVIKEFEDEYFVRHALILDTFTGSGGETLFEEAIRIASSYIRSFQTDESILDLMLVGRHIYSFSSGRGLAHSENMLEILACAEPSEDKTILELVPALQSGIKNFSGAICIFLDWEAGHRKIYQVFKQSRSPVFIIVLTEDTLKMQEKIFQDLSPDPQIKVVEKGNILEVLGAG